MVEQNTTFTTSDGNEFASQEAAERHEATAELRTAYLQARRQYAANLAKRFCTADNVLFEFRMTDYYFVVTPFHAMPYIEKVLFYGDNFEYDLDGYHKDGRLRIIHYRRDPDQRALLDIGDLYASQTKAEKRLIGAMIQYIGWLQEDLKRLQEGGVR